MSEITPNINDAEAISVLEGIDVTDQNAVRNALQHASPRQTFMVAMPFVFSRRPDISSKMTGLDGAVMWIIDGEGGGKFALNFSAGRLSVSEGGDTARSTIKLDLDTWKDISAGKTNPLKAFMQGKLMIEGDMNFLMQIQSAVPQI